MFQIYVKGYCAPNPGGTACYAFVAKKDGEFYADENGPAGFGQNVSHCNGGYEGLLAAMKLVAEDDIRDVTIFSDALMLANQWTGEFAVNKSWIKKKIAECKKLAEGRNVAIKWIPASENAEATKLCMELLKEAGPTPEFLMPFGKWSGVAISKVPADYLEWMVGNMKNLRGSMKARIVEELKRRPTEDFVQQKTSFERLTAMSGERPW
jgi:ribonuclease HI